MLSSAHRILSLSALAVLLAACLDPAAKFDDFADRIGDRPPLPAGCPEPSGPPLATIPDISGSALLSMRIGFAAGAPPIQTLATFTQTGTGPTGTLDVTLRVLSQSTREPVGEPLTKTGVAIAETGEFCIAFDTLNVPGAGNPISSSDVIAEDVVFIGSIKSADSTCGTVNGMVTSPITQTLGGSTFASIRVPPGQMGSALPQPVSACPATVDAGM